MPARVRTLTSAQRRRLVGWLAALTLLVPLTWLLPARRLFDTPAPYAQLHLVLELGSICVASMVFALAWTLRGTDGRGAGCVLGPTFIAVALIDLAHAMSYAGMPDLVTPAGPEKAIHFWLAARLVAAVGLCAVALVPAPRCRMPVTLGVALAAVVLVWWMGLYRADLLPRTFDAGSGLTPLKIGIELTLALAFALAALRLLQRGWREGDEGPAWLGAAAWVLALTELYFTQYDDVGDTFNLLGHLYKGVASAMVYRAIFVSGVKRPQMELQLERARLQAAERALGDRMRERECLHQVFALTEDLRAPLAPQLQAVVACLPAAWPASAGVTAQVAVEGELHASAGFDPAAVRLRAQAPLDADAAAVVSVGWRGPEGMPPDPSGGDRQALLDAVAARLAGVVAARRIERRLGERQEVYSAIVNQASDAIGLIDRRDGRFVEFNDAAARNLGYTREQFAALTLMDLEVERDAQALTRAGQEVLAGGPQVFESRHRHRDGSLRDVLVRVRALELGGHPYFATIWTDITERKRADRALEESELHFRALANSGSALIWTADAQGARVYFNEPWLRLTGRSTHQESGDGWMDGVHPDDRQSRLGFAQSAMARRESYSVEYRLRDHDGQWHWLREDGSARRDSQGRFLGYIGFCVDISAPKRAAAELERYRQELEQRVEERTRELAQAKDAAEAATRAKSTFLATMSHEIRTPLNAILGMTHLLRRSNPTPQQDERLAHVDAAGELLLSIVNAVLDLSKIEAGKYRLDDAPVGVANLVDSVATLMSERAQAKGLRLIVQTHALPSRLRGDPVRLKQALLNYVANAVKFTERGQITLRAQREHQDTDGVLLRFEVEDTGPGIEPDTLARLFTAFEQADGTTTRLHGGTGLGLALTRHLARLMGGDAGACSRPGEGSTFWFTARLRHGVEVPEDPVPGNTEAEHALRRRHAGRRVLVAEDEPVNQELVQILLQDVGLRPVVVPDGAQALAQVAEGGHALVLMDMQMPRLDGLEATRRIRRLEGPVAAVPVLALTANAFVEDRERCMAAGMNDFVAKPLDPQRLYEVVLKWLDRAFPDGDAAAPR
ncbi:MAG: MASE3 domain-containing protein [Rubrivivax sp.]